MKGSGKVLSARVIETLINETLSDAEHLDIPGVILKPMTKKPLHRYQIDSLFLESQGVDKALVDRIYRGLFVYSLGFYEMVHKCLEHAKNKYTILASVWKVFSILLEYCCKSNYQMLIQKISEEHRVQMEKVEAGLLNEINELTQNENVLKQQVDQLMREKNDLTA